MHIKYHMLIDLASVVQKLDSAIQRINLCPVDSAIGFSKMYPLGSDLPLDSAIQLLNNWDLDEVVNLFEGPIYPSALVLYVVKIIPPLRLFP